MLSIFAPTNDHPTILAYIQQEHRLEELVTLHDLQGHSPTPSAHSLIVDKDEISFPIDWANMQPPFILPEFVDFNEPNFLGIIFAKLNNFEKAYQYLFKTNHSLFLELDFINRLQQGLPINPDELVSQYSPFEEYRLMHNQAIVRHYASSPENFDLHKTIYFYREALKCTPHEEYYAFTARHLAFLYIDLQEVAQASDLLQKVSNFKIPDEALIEIKQVQCQAWLQQLTVPYNEALLDTLKNTLWEVLQAYEQQERVQETALLLLDAGIIANYSESWAEGLGYFNRALEIFEAADMFELAANAHYRKAILLFTWAKNGNPQFYKSSAETFQEAVKIFSRRDAPEVYADIQHHLGMIYAEIPDEQKKKSIWAAVSSSAFQEALEIYTKAHYPYEYATVCNHYGNALTKYPQARRSDNMEKALFYYNEALSIRSAAHYPTERCLTLLNYLEAQWDLAMPEDTFDEARFLDMQEKAEEIKSLTQDLSLIADAETHLQKLSKLKAAYAS